MTPGTVAEAGTGGNRSRVQEGLAGVWHWGCQVSLGSFLGRPLSSPSWLRASLGWQPHPYLCPGLSSARASWLIHQLSPDCAKGMALCPTQHL